MCACMWYCRYCNYLHSTLLYERYSCVFLEIIIPVARTEQFLGEFHASAEGLMTIFSKLRDASSIPTKIQAVGSIAVLALAFHCVKRLGTRTQADLKFVPSKAQNPAHNGPKYTYMEGAMKLIKLIRITIPKIWSNESLVRKASA